MRLPPIRPAMRLRESGRLIIGRHGQIHADLLPPAVRDALGYAHTPEYQAGFVDRRGRFLDREQAEAVMTRWGAGNPWAGHSGYVKQFVTGERKPARKSAGGGGAWDESKHPRDAAGKWTEK